MNDTLIHCLPHKGKANRNGLLCVCATAKEQKLWLYFKYWLLISLNSKYTKWNCVELILTYQYIYHLRSIAVNWRSIPCERTKEKRENENKTLLTDIFSANRKTHARTHTHTESSDITSIYSCSHTIIQVTEQSTVRVCVHASHIPNVPLNVWNTAKSPTHNTWNYMVWYWYVVTFILFFLWWLSFVKTHIKNEERTNTE